VITRLTAKASPRTTLRSLFLPAYATTKVLPEVEASKPLIAAFPRQATRISALPYLGDETGKEGDSAEGKFIEPQIALAYRPTAGTSSPITSRC